MIWFVGAASAWEVNGSDWSHQDAPVEEPFAINLGSFEDETNDLAFVEAAYQDAQAVWNTEGGADVAYEYGGDDDTTRQGNGNDDHNVMLFGGSTWGAGLAVATMTYNGGRATDCDIQIWNSNRYGTISWHFGDNGAPDYDFDFRQTATHELGHCLGMGHSDLDEAVMYGYNVSGTGEAARHLHEDDIEGLNYLYGTVAPELVLVEAVTDGTPGAGEGFTLTATIENVGDGSAFDVVLILDGDGPLDFGAPIDIGDVGSDTPVGERIGPSVIEVPFTLETTDGCDEDETVELTLTAGDGIGESWSFPVSVEVACAPVVPDDEDDEEEPRGPGQRGAAGCGCDSSGASVGWVVGLMALVGRRRCR